MRRVFPREVDVHSGAPRPRAIATPGILRLPAYVGHTDSEAESRLTIKREAARAWMRQRGIADLNEPMEGA